MSQLEKASYRAVERKFPCILRSVLDSSVKIANDQ